MGAMGLRRLLVMPSGPGALLMGVSLMAASISVELILNSGDVLLMLMVLSETGCGSGCCGKSLSVAVLFQ